MTDIDYTQFKIVGVVEAQPNTKHAIINAVGYLGSDWKFTPLSPTEAKQVFPSRGRVFAPGFQDRYKELIGKCIFAGMMPSNNGWCGQIYLGQRKWYARRIWHCYHQWVS